MKFAFVVNNYPPRTGGVELHVQALALELVCTGHEAVVVTLGADTGWRDDDGISVLTLPERFRVLDILGFPRLGTRRRLTKLLRERGIDVVSVHTRFFPMSYVGMRAARAADIPIVHTEHGSDHVASDSVLIRIASRLVDLTVGRAVLRRADQVLGVSEAVVAFVRRLAGVDAEVFYNAISPGIVAEEAVTDRSAHLVFVGRIVPGKGWEDYLEAIAALRADGEEVSSEMLGDGVDMPRLRERVAALGLEDVVDIRGRVPQTAVRAALRGATLVNPTRLAEGFQTTLLEAIAERGRVVTYSVPGAEELKRQGAPVRVVSEKNSDALHAQLTRMLTEPPELATEDFIEAWTWPARAEQYLDICVRVTPPRVPFRPESRG